MTQRLLSPSIHKFDVEFIPSGLRAEGVNLTRLSGAFGLAS